MHECTGCGAAVDRTYRFCPWCAAPQRRKLVELFPGSTRIDGDTARGLRVSRYLDEGHVRFSVWDGERVDAVVSIEDAELDRLRRLLAPPPRPRRASLLDRAAERVGLRL
ncbi:MAG TPA: hypothetical protein VM290_02655 [Gaiellaceae bacterium]|nr:hypothetical protein [Gaiellaceae bacterium]